MALAIVSDTTKAIDVRAEQMRRKFSLFAKKAWEHIDPMPLVWGWHLDAMCDHLQWLYEFDGQCDLLINIPPGHAKSMIVSVLFPAWIWTRDPSYQVLGSSYEMTLATRDALKTRDLVDCQWFKDHFRQGLREWEWHPDQNLKTAYKNSLGGYRLSLSVGGKGTGLRGNMLIVDDSLKAEDAYSEPARKKSIRWFFETMGTRFNQMTQRKRVIIGQRIHEADLPGELLRRQKRQELPSLETLILPGEFLPKERFVTRMGWTDPRTEEGEPLFPAMFPKSVLAAMKPELGSYAYSAQVMQKPTPAEGGMIKRAWFNRRYIIDGEGERPLDGFTVRTLPANIRKERYFDWIEIISDCAFKDLEHSDKVAIGCWGRKGPHIYLLDLKWDRMSFTETLAAIRDMKAKWGKLVSAVCIEDKANGTAVIEVLKATIPGVIAIEPEGGKESRVMGTSKFFEAGNVWLPQSAYWVGDAIEEAVTFPKGAHDDWIDMTAYAAIRMLAMDGIMFLESMVEGQ